MFPHLLVDFYHQWFDIKLSIGLYVKATKVLALVDKSAFIRCCSRSRSNIPKHIPMLAKTTNVHMRCLLRVSHIMIFYRFLHELLILVELLVKLGQTLLYVILYFCFYLFDPRWRVINVELFHLQENYIVNWFHILYYLQIDFGLLLRFRYHLLHHFFPMIVKHLFPLALNSVKAILFQLVQDVSIINFHYLTVLLIKSHRLILIIKISEKCLLAVVFGKCAIFVILHIFLSFEKKIRNIKFEK